MLDEKLVQITEWLRRGDRGLGINAGEDAGGAYCGASLFEYKFSMDTRVVCCYRETLADALLYLEIPAEAEATQ